MSVTTIFNRQAGDELSLDNAIGPRKKLFLRGPELIDEHGVVLAELAHMAGVYRWRPVCVDNEEPVTDWFCEELVFVGQGKLDL